MKFWYNSFLLLKVDFIVVFSSYLKGGNEIHPYKMDEIGKNYVKFEKHNIHYLFDNDGNIYFNAKNIAVALGYTYPKDAISNNVDTDDKIKLENINTDMETDGVHPHSIYLNESGLYSIMLSSKLKKAKKFKKWITSKVVPSLRKLSYYELKGKMDSLMEKINKL